jgi:hypothetical protein
MAAMGGFTPWLYALGVVLVVLGLVVAGLYTQFVKSDCPECDRRMSTRLADMEPEDLDVLQRWGLRCFQANGRWYSRPIRNEDDTRDWVRLMRRVVVCETCDLYAVIGKYIEMDVSPDELLELDTRYALAPDLVKQLRESTADSTQPRFPEGAAVSPCSAANRSIGFRSEAIATDLPFPRE